jgi:hypothetical protein
MKQTNILLQKGSLHIVVGKFIRWPRLVKVIPWKIAAESVFALP